MKQETVAFQTYLRSRSKVAIWFQDDCEQKGRGRRPTACGGECLRVCCNLPSFGNAICGLMWNQCYFFTTLLQYIFSHTIYTTEYLRVMWCYHFVFHSRNSLARGSQAIKERKNDLVMLHNNSGPDHLKGDEISTEEYEGIITGYTDARRNIFTKSRAYHREGQGPEKKAVDRETAKWFLRTEYRYMRSRPCRKGQTLCKKGTLNQNYHGLRCTFVRASTPTRMRSKARREKQCFGREKWFFLIRLPSLMELSISLIEGCER